MAGKKKTGPPPIPKPPKPGESLVRGDDTYGEGFPERYPTPDIAKPEAEKCPDCLMPRQGWSRLPDGRHVPPCRCGLHILPDYEPDPLDYRMWKRGSDGKINVLTPIGALDKVFAFAQHGKHIGDYDGSVFEEVRSVLYATTGYAEYRPKE